MIDFAATTYRAFIHALSGTGEEARDVWDMMMPEQKEFWYELFNRFVEIADSLDGTDYKDATKAFFVQCANRSWTDERPMARIAWQAALRHLVYLHDNMDDVTDLSALEQGWRGWATEKKAKLSAPTLAPQSTQGVESEGTPCPQSQKPRKSKRKRSR